MNKTVPIDLATDPLTRGRIEHTVGAWARFWLNFALFQNIHFKPFDWVNGAFCDFFGIQALGQQNELIRPCTYLCLSMLWTGALMKIIARPLSSSFL